MLTRTHDEDDPETKAHLYFSFFTRHRYSPSLLHSRLETVHLCTCGLTSIPDAIYEMPYLEDLSLTDNEITEIDEKISRLTNLELLNLDNNKLTEFPETFNKLKSLVTLYAAYNDITSIEPLSGLTSLRTLYVAYNKIQTIPEVLIGRNTSTETSTTIQYQNLERTTTPKLIKSTTGTLPNLRSFEINNNPLESIPSLDGFVNMLYMLIPEETSLLDSKPYKFLHRCKLYTTDITV